MCTNFSPTRNGTWVERSLGVDWPEMHYPPEAYPGYDAPIALLGDDRQIPTVRTARFGLVPNWAKDNTIGRRTYNARCETVAEKPSYRSPWRKRQYAIALLDDFFEPNWETGVAVRWRIKRRDGEPMGVASIWDRWLDTQTGEIVHSFSMLTVNADGHAVMGHFHRPGDEKRSVVVLEPEQFKPWLMANPQTAMEMCRCPEEAVLVSEPAPRAGQYQATLSLI
ncbi:MAG: hypothetical protein RLZZ591_2916 [Pseudomonadota bacterium]|jgi:putative SOS response-associated peptidase YedK